MFIATVFTVAKIGKCPKCPPIHEWIKKGWHMYIIEYYLAIKNEILPFVAVWMDVEGIMLSEISQRKTNPT